MKTKIIFASLFVVILLMTFIPLGKALEQVDSGSAPFNLGSYLTHVWHLEITSPYSIVGDKRSCGYGPDRDANYVYSNLQADSYTIIHASDHCGSSYALFDIYVNGWNPYLEKGNDFGFTCHSAQAPCNIEVYCCPYGWCSSLGGDSYCSSEVGPGSTCETSTEEDDGIQLDFSSWSYCTQEESVDCWYSTSTGTSCIKRTYPGQTTCPASYMDFPLYSSESLCLNHVCDNTCPAKSSVDCGDDIISTKSGCTCSGTGTKCSTGTCTNGACVGGGCPSGQELCNGVCVASGTCGGGGNEGCVGAEETFYSKGTLTINQVLLNWFLVKVGQSSTSGSFEDNYDKVKKFLPNVYNNYKPEVSTACCTNLSAQFIEEKSGTFNSDAILSIFGLKIGPENHLDYKYDIYKCSKESPGFCIEQAQTWLNGFTHADNCQTNSFYLIGAAVVVLIIFMALLRGGK